MSANLCCITQEYKKALLASEQVAHIKLKSSCAARLRTLLHYPAFAHCLDPILSPFLKHRLQLK
jgi:hypothetical protein